MKLSDIKRESDLVIIDLGAEGRTEAEKTQRFLIQEVGKVKGFCNKVCSFFTREKLLIAHEVHKDIAISKQEYFETEEAAKVYKAKIVQAYKGIEEKLKSI